MSAMATDMEVKQGTIIIPEDIADTRELGEDGLEDMINLISLNESLLLENLRLRYAKENIYTYTGSILVAVNPYKMFNIYGLDMVKKYQEQVIGTQPPHLFAIGNAAYCGLVKDAHNQVVVISGESGAGKTESTKLIMQYLAAVNKGSNSIITEQILEANPLLESFGNAKTIRNDNSSRFGKYVELYFRRGAIVGAKTSEYLLEKSRIVSQAANERNYHVFYELLMGLTGEEKKKYGLKSASDYFYLNQGGSCDIASKNDEDDFGKLRGAMEILSFTSTEQETIFQILACVLHVGNIKFSQTQNAHQHEGVEVSTVTEMKWVAYLLELSEDSLKEAFTMKVTQARQERMLTPLSTEQAMDARDAVAKALYQTLFTWLVERVNGIVKDQNASGQKSPYKTSSIAILDIFGFEDFLENSFEQLCINYANENLQYYFNKHIFKLEQQEYQKECIAWQHITFHDNQPAIDVIAQKPNGILHLLDDESNFPKGTAASFLEKCHQAHYTNQWYEKPRMPDPTFSIRHYAGLVTYSVASFLDKNRDLLHSSVVKLLKKSKNKMISQMFKELQDTGAMRTMNKTSGLYVTVKSKTPTVAASFHESLNKLIERMSKCAPWFVRCIKPNVDKAPMHFDEQIVLAQLRYTGMLETIRIRKLGYPIRVRFHTFADRYFVLLQNQYNVLGRKRDDKDVCTTVLNKINPKWALDWQMGMTKVFLKEGLGHHLDEQRSEVTQKSIVCIQSRTRGFLARRKFLLAKKATIVLQSAIRRLLARKRYLKMLRGFVFAQAQWCMVVQRRWFRRTMQEKRRRLEEDIQRREESRKRRQLEETHRYQREEETRLGRERMRVESMRREEGEKRRKDEERRMDEERRRRETETMRQRQVMGRQEEVDRERRRREKQTRMLASIAQLEIPQQLAFVFSKLDDWSPAHSDSNLALVENGVFPRNLNLALPQDVNSFAFSKFANVYFQNHQWKMTKAPIVSPFLPKHSDSEFKDSVSIFKLILRFMSDATLTGRRLQVLANYIIEMGLSVESLQDEILVQLCSQTWLNRDEASVARGWLLAACCLSSFAPSRVLATYLLKYVSDHAYDGYKAFCQQKLLQCAYMEPRVNRTYPPCQLEWKSAKKRSCMALECSLPDSESYVVHVESWMTAEEFASHLLQCQRITEGHHGWMVTLLEENDIYECAGYDYVLDLVSEMEVPPGFPFGSSYFLVTTDRTREVMSARREQLQRLRSPHDPERVREMPQEVPELLEPVPVCPRPAPLPENFFHYGSRPESLNEADYATRDEILATDQGLSRNSILNVRYTKRQAPAPPGVSSSPPPRAVSPPPRRPAPLRPQGRPMTPPRHLSPIPSISAVGGFLNFAETEASSGINTEIEAALAPNRLNQRYAASRSSIPNGSLPPRGSLPNGSLPNGSVQNGQTEEEMYRHYTQYATSIPSENANPWKHRSNAPSGRSMNRSDITMPHSTRSGPSDMDQWLDQVFDPVLDGNLDDLSDVKSLENRLRGGSDTAVDIQPQSQPHMNSDPSHKASFAPIHPPEGSNGVQDVGSTGPAGLSNGNPPVPSNGVVPGMSEGAPNLWAQQMVGLQQQQLMQQQVAQQQAAAQQAAQQQVAQHIAAHQIAQQIHAQQMQQQSTSLEAQVQMAHLQKQLLETTVQTELLKEQLASIKNRGPSPPPASQRRPFSPPLVPPPTIAALAPNVVLMTPKFARHTPNKLPVPSSTPNKAQGAIDESYPGGVKTLKRAFESKMQAVTPSHFKPYVRYNNQASMEPEPPKRKKDAGERKGVKFSDSVQEIPADVPYQSPGTPQMNIATPKFPPPQTTGPQPPAEPPTAWIGSLTRPGKPMTIVDRAGNERVVRAGRTMLPPPVPAEPSITFAPRSQPPAKQQEVKQVQDRTVPATTQQRTIAPVTSSVFPAPPVLTPPPSPSDVTPLTFPPPPTLTQSDAPLSPPREPSTSFFPPSSPVSSPTPPPESFAIFQKSDRATPPAIPSQWVISEMPRQRHPPRVSLGDEGDDPVTIDMTSRRQALESQLSNIWGKGNQTNTEPAVKKPDPVRTMTGPSYPPMPPAPPVIAPTRAEPPPPPAPVFGMAPPQTNVPPLQSSQAVSLRQSTHAPPHYTHEPPGGLQNLRQAQLVQRPVPEPSTNGYDISDSEDEPDAAVDIAALEKTQTVLFAQSTGPFYMYSNVPWLLQIRKEMFTPTEKLSDPILVTLIFSQIVQDVFSNGCIRIGKDDKLKMRSRLDGYGISPTNMTSGSHSDQMKSFVIDSARDWPYYFCRFFPVNGGRRHPTVKLLGVSHSGLRFIAREKDLFADDLRMVYHIRFEEIIDVSVPRPSTLQIHVNNKYQYFIFYSYRASQMKTLIEAFCIETDKDVMYVKAIRSYLTRESTLLRFQNGDIITLTNRDTTLTRGWLYGAAHGRVGMFPKEYVVPMARYEVEGERPNRPVSPPQQRSQRRLPRTDVLPPIPQSPPRAQSPTRAQSPPPRLVQPTPMYNQRPASPVGSELSTASTIDERKYCMLEYAMLYFRQSPFRSKFGSVDVAGTSEHGQMDKDETVKAVGPFYLVSMPGEVKDPTQGSPVQASLLKFDNQQVNKMALESFIAIMRYMGDYPLQKKQKLTDCIYTLLMACHNHGELRDEVYCQLAKQTTSNRSTKPDSLHQGWKALMVLTAFFDCTENLRPYLFKYVEETAYDHSRPCHALAATCLQNIRQTFRFGGRKNVPSRMELEAITHGRSMKQQKCILPGGAPVVLNIRSSSVVVDAIDQICNTLGTYGELQKEEFTIFYVIESENRYCALKPEEYIFDLTTELTNQKKVFYLLFQRTSWVFPLQREANQMFIDMMYNQCLPDYQDGFLLSVPSSSLPFHVKNEISLLAALQLKADEKMGTPTITEVAELVPKNAQSLSDTKLPDWRDMVCDCLREVELFSPFECKSRVLQTLSRWPLFGSTFFEVKSVADARIPGPCLLSINKVGVHFLHPETHEILIFYPYSEVISTRRLRAEQNVSYLDLKCGNLMIQKITRIETDQSVDIAALIGQYIHILGTLKTRPSPRIY